MVKVLVSRRMIYTLVLVLAVVLVLGGIYALSPGVKPVVGHLIGEFAPPSPCASGSFVKWTGSVWQCAVP